MFIGSINRHMRSVVLAAADGWRGRPVYVACSGNFTIERILAAAGLTDIHSNDVSVYSCALGWHLAGRKVQFGVKLKEWEWLLPYLSPGEDAIATMLMLSEMVKFTSNTFYAKRMFAEHRDRWPGLHAKSVERVKRALDGMAVASYFAGDCRVFLASADRDGVCVTFPPTYKGGYESLYKKIDAIIDWPAPSYDLFSPEDFEAFNESVREFAGWLSGSDARQDALAQHHVATVQTTLRSKPVYMYGNTDVRRIATPRQRVGKNPYQPHSGQVTAPVDVVRIDAAQMNAIRCMYLSHKIVPADAPRNYAVISDGKLLGAFSFALPSPRSAMPVDLYVMADFAVRPTPHRRLSKLILAALLSTEVQADVEQWLCSRIAKIGTTAFTDRPVSMKYRGVFDLYSRGEGMLNYIADAGRWTLKEAVEWWVAKHSRA